MDKTKKKVNQKTKRKKTTTSKATKRKNPAEAAQNKSSSSEGPSITPSALKKLKNKQKGRSKRTKSKKLQTRLTYVMEI